MKESHQVDWEAAEVLDLCRFQYPRCMLESWHIHREPDPTNRERGPLPNLYCSLLSVVVVSHFNSHYSVKHIPFLSIHTWMTYLLFSFVTFSHSLMMMLE